MTSLRNIQTDEVAKLVAEHMMRARDNVASLEKAIDRAIEIAGQFGGRNIMDFLATYKTEMQQRDVVEEKQISSFKRVVAIGLQGRIREIQAAQTTWVGFERVLFGRIYAWRRIEDDSTHVDEVDWEEGEEHECIGVV